MSILVFFYFAENVDYTLDRSNVELGQDPVNVTVTLLNDEIVETVEELQLTLVEIENFEIAQGEYLLEDVTITIVDGNGIICIYMSCFNLHHTTLLK